MNDEAEPIAVDGLGPYVGYKATTLDKKSGIIEPAPPRAKHFPSDTFVLALPDRTKYPLREGELLWVVHDSDVLKFYLHGFSGD